MLSILLLTLLVTSVASGILRLDDQWRSFKSSYGKQYDEMEELKRMVCQRIGNPFALHHINRALSQEGDFPIDASKFKHDPYAPVRSRSASERDIWEQNLMYIQTHNLEADRGQHSFWLGENQFADMTVEEFSGMMNGFRVRNSSLSSGQLYAPNVLVPEDDVDWRTKGYVTPVKNQEKCGSCWAFSATGSLEGQTFKKTGELTSLSEQNLIDCSKREGNKGCRGGDMDKAFTYIQKNNGIDTELSYPYRATDGTCQFKADDVGATDVGHKDILRGSEEDLQKALSEVGPISAAMDAGQSSFQLYKHGVYSDMYCSSTKLDHGVLAVGYGVYEGMEYWLVKNSWGTTWGDKGYFMLARNKRNMCGLATQASYPLV